MQTVFKNENLMWKNIKLYFPSGSCICSEDLFICSDLDIAYTGYKIITRRQFILKSLVWIAPKLETLAFKLATKIKDKQWLQMMSIWLVLMLDACIIYEYTNPIKKVSWIGQSTIKTYKCIFVYFGSWLSYSTDFWEICKYFGVC